jgi:hypothetical protein
LKEIDDLEHPVIVDKVGDCLVGASGEVNYKAVI